MSNIECRLRAILDCDSINGDAMERRVVKSQIREAIFEIEYLRGVINEIKENHKMTIREIIDRMYIGR